MLANLLLKVDAFGHFGILSWNSKSKGLEFNQMIQLSGLIKMKKYILAKILPIILLKGQKLKAWSGHRYSWVR